MPGALHYIYIAGHGLRIPSPYLMAELYYIETVPIARMWLIQIRILIITVPIFGTDIRAWIGIRVRVWQCE